MQIKSHSRKVVQVAQSCPTLCDPMGYTVHGILQARILEWVAFPFSRGSFQRRDQTQVSYIAGRFFTSWAPRKPKNTRVGSLSLLQGIFPTQGIQPVSPALQADSLPTELSGKPPKWDAWNIQAANDIDHTSWASETNGACELLGQHQVPGGLSQVFIRGLCTRR